MATCSNCGRSFSLHLARIMFDQSYAPNLYYDDLDDEFCMGCITEMINNGTLEVDETYSDEREPDINHHLGMYN